MAVGKRGKRKMGMRKNKNQGGSQGEQSKPIWYIEPRRLEHGSDIGRGSKNMGWREK